MSTAAAKLFADIAADILEDEQEEELMQQEAQPAVVETPPQLVQNNVFVDANQQVLINQPRIIVSQPQMNQVRLILLTNLQTNKLPIQRCKKHRCTF